MVPNIGRPPLPAQPVLPFEGPVPVSGWKKSCKLNHNEHRRIVRILHNVCLWRFHPSFHCLQQDLKSHCLVGFVPAFNLSFFNVFLPYWAECWWNQIFWNLSLFLWGFKLSFHLSFSNHIEQNGNKTKISRTGLRVCENSTSYSWGSWRWRSTTARSLLSLYW